MSKKCFLLLKKEWEGTVTFVDVLKIERVVWGEKKIKGSPKKNKQTKN